MEKVKSVGILTAGGDCPGLNAAIRGVVKPLLDHGVEVIGIKDGYRGLIRNNTITFTQKEASGLLTIGGTILGTSRVKPKKYPMPDGSKADKTDEAVSNYMKLGLDALVCIGGGGTQKNAFHLYKNGIENIVTLPKTIDNDVYGTDVTFGYDSGMSIACEAIDRLHTTASSHHRCMLVDVMGHNSGWLALGAGIGGGADVILIPEFPFDPDEVIKALKKREKNKKRFSIIAVAEGAITQKEAEKRENMSKKDIKKREAGLKESVSSMLSGLIEKEVGIETRITTLGHLQRGGIPTPRDRVLASRLGIEAAELILNRQFGYMVAVKSNGFKAVPLEEVVGKKKLVNKDSGLVKTAKWLDVSLGIEL